MRRIRMTRLAPAGVVLVALLGLMGTSKTAVAGTWLNGNPQPFTAICQSNQTGAGDTRYAGHDCGEANNPDVLVPAQPGQCFYLSDITVYNNNPVNGAGHEVDLLDVTNSRANPAKVVFVAPWDVDANPTVQSQDWQTPIVFTGSLFADVRPANNNVLITVSGFYNKCPGN